jgi:hypothetical protein
VGYRKAEGGVANLIFFKVRKMEEEIRIPKTVLYQILRENKERS